MTSSLLRNSYAARPSAHNQFSKLLKDTEHSRDAFSKQAYALQIAERSPNESLRLPYRTLRVINRATLIHALNIHYNPVTPHILNIKRHPLGAGLSERGITPRDRFEAVELRVHQGGCRDPGRREPQREAAKNAGQGLGGGMGM